MSSTERKLTLQEMRAAMRQDWRHYLEDLARMPADQQERYAQSNGYARLRDLLAHLLAWWDETVRLVPLMLQGDKARFGYESVDAFNAAAVARYQSRSREEVEAEFLRARDGMAALLEWLPEPALENERVYGWMYASAVEHYQEHRLP